MIKTTEEKEVFYVSDLERIFGSGVKNLDRCLDILTEYYHSLPKEERPHVIGEPLFTALDNQVGNLLNSAMEKANSEIAFFNLENVKERYSSFVDEIDKDREKFRRRLNRLKRDSERIEKLNKTKIPYQEDRFGRVYLNQVSRKMVYEIAGELKDE